MDGRPHPALHHPTDADWATDAAAAAYCVDVAHTVRGGGVSPAAATALLVAIMSPALRVEGGHSSIACYATVDVVEALLGAGADPNATDDSLVPGTPVLHYAAGVPDGALCALLLAGGANPNAGVPVPVRGARSASHGRTPLHEAACTDTVQALLAAGADTTALCVLRTSVLCSPAAIADPEACRLLLAAGASASAVDCNGESPLHLARSLGVVQLLLSAGAVAGAVSGLYGQSTLYSPAALADPEATAALVAAGADATLIDHMGYTPLHQVMSVQAAKVRLRILTRCARTRSCKHSRFCALPFPA
jgi:ankyrin repeat protein